VPKCSSGRLDPVRRRAAPARVLRRSVPAISIARALVLEPRCSSATSPFGARRLDPGQIINLLEAMKARFSLTLCLSAMTSLWSATSATGWRHVPGKLCELHRRRLVPHAAHPYTARCSPRSRARPGNRPIDDGTTDRELRRRSTHVGCRFRTRCPVPRAVRSRRASAARGATGQRVACHFPLVEAARRRRTSQPTERVAPEQRDGEHVTFSYEEATRW